MLTRCDRRGFKYYLTIQEALCLNHNILDSQVAFETPLVTSKKSLAFESQMLSGVVSDSFRTSAYSSFISCRNQISTSAIIGFLDVFRAWAGRVSLWICCTNFTADFTPPLRGQSRRRALTKTKIIKSLQSKCICAAQYHINVLKGLAFIHPNSLWTTYMPP